MTLPGQHEIEMRPFAEADFEAVRSLFSKVWHGAVRTMPHDRMRFADGPTGATIASVAMLGARCVGFFTLWPMTLTDGVREVAAGQAMDVMTDPGFQGQGIFPRLARMTCESAARRDVQILFGAPNGLIFPGYVKRLNWAAPARISTYVRPLSLSGLVPLGAALTPALRLLPLSAGRGAQLSIEPPAPDELERFLAGLSPERGVWRVHRTPEWYAFRYQPAGMVDYSWVSVRRNGELAGLAIWGLQRERPGKLVRGNLVELLGRDVAARRSALAGAVRACSAAGAHLIAATTTSRSLAKLFRRSGFLRYRSGPLIVRTLGWESFDANPFVADSWDLMGADFDFV